MKSIDEQALRMRIETVVPTLNEYQRRIYLSAEAKALGRQVSNFDETTWNSKRFDIVVQGNIEKFTQNKDLEEFLLNTKESVLVEASPVDRIWGIGLAVDNEKVKNPKTWNGLNLLGFALMEAREIIRKSQKI